MKIVHLTGRFHPHIGGIERHVLEVAGEQARRGHQVTVIASDHPGALAEQETLNGFQIRRFPGARSIWRKRLWFLKHALLLHRADAVHTHDQSQLAFILRYVPKSRRILTAHGWGGVYPIPTEQVEQTRERVSQCRAVMAVGHFVGQWHDFQPDVISYGAVDLQACPKDPDRVRNSICLFGRLAADTGALETARALRRLAESLDTPPSHRLRVSVAGDGELADAVRGQLDHPKIELEWIGFGPDVMPVLARHDIVCTSGYLGILEAMGCGARVLSFHDNPVKQDYLTLSPMAEWMSINADEEQITASLTKLLNSKQPAAPAAIAFAKAQTWGRVADIYEQLYLPAPGPALGASKSRSEP